MTLPAFTAPAQNRAFAQKTIDTLSSAAFSGRGYVGDGDKKAAVYIGWLFMKLGVQPIKNHGYLYPFNFPVNTFPGICKVKINRKTLRPGLDYIVNPASPGLKKKFVIHPVSDHQIPEFENSKTALLFDTSYKPEKEELEKAAAYPLRIMLQKKLTWSVSTSQSQRTEIEILRSSLPPNPKSIRVNIQTQLVNHTAYNVLGFIEGTRVKDSFIVLTAHYDHLGMMGQKTMFPGANDNASGVAMLLDMASYFSRHPHKYSIAFIAFAGEEAGLIGSKDYTDNPWEELNLGSMKFLINLDLMGSGEKGLAVVNATVFPEQFGKLQNINAGKKYLSGFKSRGKAANSDHYWFTERGVKSFFFYLMGDYNHYHDLEDNNRNLRLSEYYDKSFLLIRDFILVI